METEKQAIADYVDYLIQNGYITKAEFYENKKNINFSIFEQMEDWNPMTAMHLEILEKLIVAPIFSDDVEDNQTLNSGQPDNSVRSRYKTEIARYDPNVYQVYLSNKLQADRIAHMLEHASKAMSALKPYFYLPERVVKRFENIQVYLCGSLKVFEVTNYTVYFSNIEKHGAAYSVTDIVEDVMLEIEKIFLEDTKQA